MSESNLREALQAADFDISALAGSTAGFSGAEIEQSIVAATYLAREQGVALNTGHLYSEIEQTRPLSRVMAEPMARLRHWARDRTVLAN